MDNGSKKIILSATAKDIIDAEVRGENLLNQQRSPNPVLSFSQDALECSATTSNMSSASLPKVKKGFSISGSSSPLSGSANSSPKSIRIENTENKLNVSLEGILEESAELVRRKNLGSTKK